MLVKKTWSSKSYITIRTHFGNNHVAKYSYTGWFLFGIIPLYIIRE